jgi:hypothetical protein
MIYFRSEKDSVFQETPVAEKDYLDEILPKRGRLKKKESRSMFITPLKLQILQDIKILTLL